MLKTEIPCYEYNLMNIDKELKEYVIKEEIKEKKGISSKNINNNFINFYPLSFENIDKKLLFSRNNILLSFKNQNLTKKLQKNLIGISKEIIDYIINELSGFFRTCIKDKNGNYFCSSLIRICNKEQRLKIFKELSNTISEDSIDEFGTHTIQNLIEIASNEEEFTLLLSSFKDFNDIIIPSLNKFGTYVIQKIFKHIPEELRINFNYIFVNFISILSRDAYGILAVKAFIGYTKDKIIVRRFCNIISSNFNNICENKYGNYLIQYLLEIWWNKEEGKFLKNKIISKFSILSQNEYSSHVCAFFIKLTDINQTDNSFCNINQLKDKKKKYY